MTIGLGLAVSPFLLPDLNCSVVGVFLWLLIIGCLLDDTPFQEVPYNYMRWCIRLCSAYPTR